MNRKNRLVFNPRTKSVMNIFDLAVFY